MYDVCVRLYHWPALQDLPGMVTPIPAMSAAGPSMVMSKGAKSEMNAPAVSPNAIAKPYIIATPLPASIVSYYKLQTRQQRKQTSKLS